VKNHDVDAGLIIHEGQLTYGHGGLHAVIDLGKWFKTQYGLPLPLGANALRRDLSPEVQAECARMMRESIQHSLEHREEALNYAMQFARDLDLTSAEQFVGMYVNDHTVDGGEIVPRAAQKLLDLGFEAGLIPHKTTVEVIR
jgi:1,4-dihydroxy-6-naphthoate synthase